MGIRAAAIIAVVLATGCKYGAEEFACSSDSQCGATGQCENNGFCSFADASCDSGRRFGTLGGANTGECVLNPRPLVDAGDTIDSPPPPPDARACFGTGIVQVCLAKAPTEALMISDAKIINTGDTTATSPCVATVSGGDNYCVVAATTISIINSQLRAIGPKPLVLLASESITSTASASIDVGSRRGVAETIGAGADPMAACAAGTAPSGLGGGAGGSFAGKGGNGGNGANVAATGGGAAPAAAPPINTLRGGCPGQTGSGAAAGDRGPAGHGGGAVFLIAGTMIDLAGNIDASGEGARGGLDNAGGAGGGGSGGMIGLDAPTVHVTGTLVANGGGGGEGCSSGGTAGDVGDDAGMLTAAAGGSGQSNSGGDGGNGAAGATGGIAGNADTGGGGGGGGGAGLIKAPAGAMLGQVSPAVTP